LNDTPAAIPWYKSHVLRALLTIALSQGIARLQSKFHIDVSLYGIGVNDMVSFLMDAISGVALAWAAKARVTMPQPTITATKTQAAAINAAQESTK
jgi:hypothetical protein